MERRQNAASPVIITGLAAKYNNQPVLAGGSGCCGRFNGYFLLFVGQQIGFTEGFAFGKIHQDGRCYKNRRIGTCNNTDEHGKGKTLGYLATYQEQDKKGEDQR